jgi:chemotaxis signal transduction protein
MTDQNQAVESDRGASFKQYLVIQLNEDRFFITLDIVNRIINPLEIFALPDTPDYLLGVANNTGEILPIVDLKRILKLPVLKSAIPGKYLITKYRDMKIGFVVDQVLDAWPVDTSKINTETTRVTESEYISGEYIHENEVIGIIDIARIIDEHKAA